MGLEILAHNKQHVLLRSKGTTAIDLSIECRLENHTKEGGDEVDDKDKDEEDMTAMIE